MKTSGQCRALMRVRLWSAAVVLAFGGAARAEQPAGPEVPVAASPERAASSYWIAVEGGWAHPSLDIHYNSADDYIGTTIPFRVDVGVKLSDHLWLAPFVSLAWVHGVEAPDGFRMLLGGELQLHLATMDDSFDYFGGVGVAFERLVAHSTFGDCSHCDPSVETLMGNGVNLELRVGLLVRCARFMWIGPYLGGQLAWLPSFTSINPGSPDPSTGQSGPPSRYAQSTLLFWLDVGVRLVFPL